MRWLDDPAYRQYVYEGNVETARLWIQEHRHDLATTDVDGLTPFTTITAFSKTTDEILALFIDAGSDVNTPVVHTRYTYTPLIRSIGCASTSTVEFLLKAGARVNDTDSNGITALMHAMEWYITDSDRIVDLLLNHGADINAISNGRRSVINSAITRACCSHDVRRSDLAIRTVKKLIDRGVDLDNVVYPSTYDVNPQTLAQIRKMIDDERRKCPKSLLIQCIKWTCAHVLDFPAGKLRKTLPRELIDKIIEYHERQYPLDIASKLHKHYTELAKRVTSSIDSGV